MLRMKWFVNNYISADKHVRVLDVGSFDVNGNYRILFEGRDIDYIGLDMSAGPNVDYTPQDPYQWSELEDESFDFVISGNAFEHIEYPWLTICEIYRKLKNGGFACILAPNSLREHRYPMDCYRYFSDGFRALAKWGGFEVVDVTVSGVPDENVSPEWYAAGQNDTMMILAKGIESEKIEVLPKFKCEKRYRHASEWEWRYHFMIEWYNEQNKVNLLQSYVKRKHIKKLYMYGYSEIGKIVYKELKNIKGIEIYLIDQRAERISEINTIKTGEHIDESEDSYMLCTLLDMDLLDKLNQIYPDIRKKYIGDIFAINMKNDAGC